jgi:hypothetical protein
MVKSCRLKRRGGGSIRAHEFNNQAIASKQAKQGFISTPRVSKLSHALKSFRGSKVKGGGRGANLFFDDGGKLGGRKN